MTKEVFLGGRGKTKRISIGGGAPVSLQTMWKQPINNLDDKKLNEIVNTIEQLSELGCDIIRFAVPDVQSAKGLCSLVA